MFRWTSLAVVLAIALSAFPVAAQRPPLDNTAPPEKIEPSPKPLRPGPERGTMTPPMTGDAEIAKPPPADTRFPTPVVPPSQR